jgi:hypothetical protein
MQHFHRPSRLPQHRTLSLFLCHGDAFYQCARTLHAGGDMEFVALLSAVRFLKERGKTCEPIPNGGVAN